jgi:hypothetical protein
MKIMRIMAGPGGRVVYGIGLGRLVTRVRIPLGAWMFGCLRVCVVLSCVGRGLATG